MKSKFKKGDYVFVLGPPDEKEYKYWGTYKKHFIGRIMLLDEIFDKYDLTEKDKDGYHWSEGYAFHPRWLRLATPQEILAHKLDKACGLLEES